MSWRERDVELCLSQMSFFRFRIFFVLNSLYSIVFSHFQWQLQSGNFPVSLQEQPFSLWCPGNMAKYKEATGTGKIQGMKMSKWGCWFFLGGLCTGVGRTGARLVCYKLFFRVVRVGVTADPCCLMDESWAWGQSLQGEGQDLAHRILQKLQ